MGSYLKGKPIRKRYLENFDKCEEHLYRIAIKEFGGKGLYIDNNAYWKDGHKDPKLLTLKCIGNDVDLSEFWNILKRVKKNFNKELYCPCCGQPIK